MLVQYYTTYDEKRRLKKDNAHLVEYRTTLQYLQKYIMNLPRGSTLLDCCAGCGVYAFPLAEMGFEVTAVDLMQKHVDIIKTSNKSSLLKNVYQGNVLDMSRFAENSFDVVLCFGALYHLQISTEREKCIQECLRVLKGGGLIFFAYINRNAIFINHFKHSPVDIKELDELLLTGRNGVFYGMDFEEPDMLAGKFKIDKIANIAIDGLSYPLADQINILDEEQFETYMKYHLATCEQKALLGHSMHGLWIGRKTNGKSLPNETYP